MREIKSFPEFGGPIQQAVFPLVAKVDDQIWPVGTGFAIHPNGLFISAAHVIEAAHNYAVRRRKPDGASYSHYEFYAIYVSDEKHADSESYNGGLLPIDHLSVPKDLDIGFGWLRLPNRITDNSKLPLKVVRLRPAIPSSGKKIAAVGYYGMTSTLSAANEPTIINYAQQTAISSGSILEVHPLYRDRGLLSFPCFRTDAVFNHGMSGGPIFDEAGNVIGVVCSGETDSSYSYGSLIWPIFGAQIDFLKEPGEAGKTIYDLAVSGKIQTDESLKSINVTTNPDGSRTINYLAPSGA